jgi:glycosyltransferase involved in cell wall biosynthesis
MKNKTIAFIVPHSMERYMPNLKRSSMPDEFDYNYAKTEGYEHRTCKANLELGYNARLYYPSRFESCIKTFRHKYGHLMKRVPLTIKNENFEYAFKLLKELKKDRPAIVIITGIYYNSYFPDMTDILTIFCKINKIPVILRSGGGSYKDLSYFKRLFKKITFNLAEKILSRSISEMNELEKYYKIDRNKLGFIPNPIDESFYEIPKINAARILKKEFSKKYILFVGRLVELKGLQYIIKIMPKILKKYPKTELLIAGDGPYKNELEKLASRHKVQNKIKFLGNLPHKKLNLYYNLVDVLVNASFSEGTPNVLMEASACNLPCIGTNVGGIPDLLKDNVGIIIPTRDENELLNAIEKVLDGNFKINQQRRKEILKEISYSSVKAKLKEVYEEILKNGA